MPTNLSPAFFDALHRKALALVIFLAVIAIVPVPAAASAVDLDGRPVDPFADRETSAIVLVFASPECPISNRLAPEVIRIYRDLEETGVRFYLVYPELEVDAEAAKRHATDYGYPFPALLDHDRTLVEKAGAKMLSEVAVFSPVGRLVYLGRVNDRFVDFGKTRPRPTRDDLREALGSLLAGKPVETPRTEAIGCFIPPLERR